MTRRLASDTPQLIPAQVAAACAALADRIHERFPGRGIDRHAHWFAAHAAGVAAEGPLRLDSRLRWLVSGAGAVVAFLLLFSPIYVWKQRLDVFDGVATYLQSLDAFITVLAATVAGRVTWIAYVGYWERQKVLPKLNALRSFAHVTDMLQLSKSPVRVLFPATSRAGWDDDHPDAVSMSAYLAFCAELHSMTAKVAALYGEWTNDATVMVAIDDVEDLCGSLEHKSTQKILLLEQLNQRVAPPPV